MCVGIQQEDELIGHLCHNLLHCISASLLISLLLFNQSLTVHLLGTATCNKIWTDVQSSALPYSHWALTIQVKSLNSSLFTQKCINYLHAHARALDLLHVLAHTIPLASVPVQFLIEVCCTHLPSIRRALQLLKVLQSLKRRHAGADY